MVIHFKLRFRSYFGQSVAVVIRDADGTSDAGVSVHELHFADGHHWAATIQLQPKTHNVAYHYIVRESGKETKDEWKGRSFSATGATIFLHDDWLYHPIENAVFNSKAFSSVLLKPESPFSNPVCKNPTHVFKARTIRFQEGKALCLLGSSPALGNWDPSRALRFSREDDFWILAVDLGRETFPIEYKMAVCDAVTGMVESFETSGNRLLEESAPGSVVVAHLHADCKSASWRGTGLNVQLSSLKTSRSWGVGDFSDLHLLTDWVSACGMKMIQLLPINDTTATYTRADSYPYSAISAFALHPVFLDAEAMATSCKTDLPSQMKQQGARLNEASTLEYEEVQALKKEAASYVFRSVKDTFFKDPGFVAFFNEHRHWLVPYAAFCCLRDHYHTADFSFWEQYAEYDEQLVHELTDVKSAHYPEIAFHYFVQYHLHVQLSGAVDYAHRAGVVMKGDLPIGVGRYSMDTWMNPSLFHMDMQAGAPPDAFTKKGQNWFFPTYNWHSMKATNYAWWRQRLTHMSHYFDAIRIDHVLGFFRIWSVPMHAIEGIFGIFVPSLPLTATDFSNAGLFFDESRYCDPYLNDELLNPLFGEQVSFVKETFLDGHRFKEAFNTQRKIESYATKHHLDPLVKQHLFDLLSDVILFRDPRQPGHFHFRIDIHDTNSFKKLSAEEQEKFHRLYINYFYEKQNALWYEVAQQKLDAIQQSSDMLICAEDLGMVPEMVEGVLRSREMLALQVQRMPKKSHQQFSHPADAPYLSVVTPSTHDMSTLRQWWEEDMHISQRFYNDLLLLEGKAPAFCEPDICRAIIRQHLESPAMWSVFLIQDLLAMDPHTRRLHPAEERINNPADPHHYWNYRMHISLDDLLTHKALSDSLLLLNKELHRC